MIRTNFNEEDGSIELNVTNVVDGFLTAKTFNKIQSAGYKIKAIPNRNEGGHGALTISIPLVKSE